MTYTAEQIEAAARLVLDEVDVGWSGIYGRPLVVRKGEMGDWQPWADIEAGSADWAVLDTAVRKLVRDIDITTINDVFDAVVDMTVADGSGDLAQRKAATMAAAIAIGEFLTGEEGK
jgi:hypothetical protein